MQETGYEIIYGAPTTLAVKKYVKVKVKYFDTSVTLKQGQGSSSLV